MEIDMPYFDTRLTDAELLHAASVMESSTAKVLAGRLEARGATAGRVQARVLAALKLIDAGQPAQAWRDLERCAAALDWKTHVPTYSPDPLED